jgi:hypothetical protein
LAGSGLVAIALLVLAYAAVSRRLLGSVISAAMVFFAVILVEDASLAHESVLLNTIFLTVALSVLLHGLSATPLAARSAAWFAAHPRPAVPAFEAVPAPPQRPHRGAGLRHIDQADDSIQPAA